MFVMYRRASEQYHERHREDAPVPLVEEPADPSESESDDLSIATAAGSGSKSRTAENV